MVRINMRVLSPAVFVSACLLGKSYSHHMDGPCDNMLTVVVVVFFWWNKCAHTSTHTNDPRDSRSNGIDSLFCMCVRVYEFMFICWRRQVDTLLEVVLFGGVKHPLLLAVCLYVYRCLSSVVRFFSKSESGFRMTRAHTRTQFCLFRIKPAFNALNCE